VTRRQRPSGMTLQVQVDDLDRAREFYGTLFGTAPEFEPHDDFLEWRVGDGETWLQIVGVPAPARPLVNRVRFRVDDLAAAAALAALGTSVSPVTTLATVVRWVDFADPWANQLGFYEDLAPLDQVAGPGGSVHDEGLFTTDRPITPA
jgi:predicted enzyme related to lactoylglutathione lyase